MLWFLYAREEIVEAENRILELESDLASANQVMIDDYLWLLDICTEFLKRKKVSISHHTDTPDWRLISYNSYLYIFSPSCLKFRGWGENTIQLIPKDKITGCGYLKGMFTEFT